MTGKPFNTQELCGKLDKTRGYNMNTVSGLPVWPASPRAEDIRIDDIAGALSRICRFNGHLKKRVRVPEDRVGEFDTVDVLQEVDDATGRIVAQHFTMPLEIYSVAQHSVLVEQKVREAYQGTPPYDGLNPPRNLLLAALLHDAHEYVLGDMVKPQKKMYSQRKNYELRWDDRIAERFGFSADLFYHPAIKEADYRVFLTEKRDLVECKATDFGKAEADPYPERIVPVLPSAARKMFLDRFNELYKGE